MSRVRVSFPPQAMKTTHAGLDLEASAARYRDALEQALVQALPDHEIVVEIDRGASALSVTIDTDDVVLARTIERDVLDHAWVVRQMGAWAVVG